MKIERKKAYLVELSNKRQIKIDEEELQKVLQAVATAQPVQLKQGFITNPNHIICIVEDQDRLQVIKDENTAYNAQIEAGTRQPTRLMALEDVFEGMDMKFLESPKPKQLT